MNIKCLYCRGFEAYQKIEYRKSIKKSEPLSFQPDFLYRSKQLQHPAR